MSIEDLENDLNTAVEQLADRHFLVADDVKKYFKDTMFPLMANIVDEIKEIDSDVSDLVEGHEDILQPETAGIFAAVITESLKMSIELKKRLKPNDLADKKVAAAIGAFRALCKTAEETLLAITVAPDDEEQPDEESPDAPEEPQATTEPANANEEAGDVG